MIRRCVWSARGRWPLKPAVLADFPTELHRRIVVRPRVDPAALAGLYRDADVFVFPSLYEAFSRAIAEAMASRLPIVTTAVGVAADALRNEESALIVPRRSAAAIVAGVRRLKGDRGFCSAARGCRSRGGRAIPPGTHRAGNACRDTRRRRWHVDDRRITALVEASCRSLQPSSPSPASASPSAGGFAAARRLPRTSSSKTSCCVTRSSGDSAPSSRPARSLAR